MGRDGFTERQIKSILTDYGNGTPAAEIASQYDVSVSTLFRWKAQYHSGLSGTEEALAYVSGLQQVLVEVSRTLMETAFGHLDDQITHALRQIGEYCDVDRAYLFRLKNNLTLMDNTHEWCAPGISPEKENLQDLPREAVPNVMRLMEL